MRLKALFVLVLSLLCLSVKADDLIQHLQDISLTVVTNQGSGSGTVFTRKDNGKTISFVWTAGHVVDSLRQTREVVENGNKKTVVEFKDAAIVNEFRESGRRIGQEIMDARVVKMSNADNGDDLALLEVRKKDFSPEKNSTEFYSGSIPEVGTELYHVGSLLGQIGANSLTTGVVSQIGRVLPLGANGIVFDQTTVTAFPGSSGGGVFLKSNGQYIGMLVRGAGEQFNFIVPVRRIRDWAHKSHVEWAMDKSIALPSETDRANIKVEDEAVISSPQGNSGESTSDPDLAGWDSLSIP